MGAVSCCGAARRRYDREGSGSSSKSGGSRSFVKDGLKFMSQWGVTNDTGAARPLPATVNPKLQTLIALIPHIEERGTTPKLDVLGDMIIIHPDP